MSARHARAGRLYGLLAAVAWSLGGLLQRELSLDVGTLTAGRALFAAAALLVWLRVSRRRHAEGTFRHLGMPGALVTLCIALASSLFIVALHYTSVADVLLLQAVSPVIAAVLGWIVLAEPVRARTWLAMALGLGGVLVMVSGGGTGSVLGDGFALLSAAAFSVSIVVIRGHRSISMVPAVALSQVLVFAVVAPFARWETIDLHALTLVAVFGVVQMAGGLALFTVAASLIPVADLSLLVLLEVVLGPLWVWLVLAQRPGTSTLLGGAGVMAAVVVQTRAAPRSVVA